MRRPDLAERNRARATHGATRGQELTGAFRSWTSLKARVNGTGNKRDRQRYVERGIGMCERWALFENFLADMGERPPGHSIERIDNARGYEPTNCRWATPKDQARNRSSGALIEHDGLNLTHAEWAERTGIERHTIGYRVRAGWPVEDVLSVAPTKANRWRNKS